jgi:pimeloyl-ACP methyl ester carboxylesterase
MTTALDGAGDAHLRERIRICEPDKGDVERHVSKLARGRPTLVVMGTHDSEYGDSSAEARTLASDLNAPALLVSGVGHYPHVEMPEVVAPAIVAFMNQLPTG